MSQTTLAISIAFSFVTAAVIGYVAYSLSRREVSGEAKMAFNMFILWWAMLAAVSLAGGMMNMLLIAGYDNVPAILALLQVLLIALIVALWALLYYLLYLYTGSKRILWPTSIFYLIILTYTLYLVNYQNAVGIKETTWTVGLDYEHKFPRWGTVALLFGLVGPQALAALAYFTLIFQVNTPTQRWRIGMISGAIFFWFGVSTWAGVFGLSEKYVWWTLVSRTTTLVMSFIILAAFNPPRFAQKRWGIQPVAKKAPHPSQATT